MANLVCSSSMLSWRLLLQWLLSTSQKQMKSEATGRRLMSSVLQERKCPQRATGDQENKILQNQIKENLLRSERSTSRQLLTFTDLYHDEMSILCFGMCEQLHLFTLTIFWYYFSILRDWFQSHQPKFILVFKPVWFNTVTWIWDDTVKLWKRHNIRDINKITQLQLQIIQMFFINCFWYNLDIFASIVNDTCQNTSTLLVYRYKNIWIHNDGCRLICSTLAEH